MGATTLERDNCQDDSEQAEERSEAEEDDFMRKIYSRRVGSPPITINRNGSRYISPIDIVRSKVGREEIRRQQSDNAKGNAEQKRTQGDSGAQTRDST